MSAPWDHPRVCGEKFPSKLLSVVILGSPPRMRGKGIQQSDSRVAVGITPAYAGKREGRAISCASFWDHPRVCGEKGTGLTNVTSPMGSPPRMRGKGLVVRAALPARRITPAYAGKSRAVIGGGHALQDHPRVCGEKTLAGLLHITAEGSPPRMRGKASRMWSSTALYRITPAYAGKRPAPRGGGLW